MRTPTILARDLEHSTVSKPREEPSRWEDHGLLAAGPVTGHAPAIGGDGDRLQLAAEQGHLVVPDRDRWAPLERRACKLLAQMAAAAREQAARCVDESARCETIWQTQGYKAAATRARSQARAAERLMDAAQQALDVRGKLMHALDEDKAKRKALMRARRRERARCRDGGRPAGDAPSAA